MIGVGQHGSTAGWPLTAAWAVLLPYNILALPGLAYASRQPQLPAQARQSPHRSTHGRRCKGCLHLLLLVTRQPRSLPWPGRQSCHNGCWKEFNQAGPQDGNVQQQSDRQRRRHLRCGLGIQESRARTKAGLAAGKNNGKGTGLMFKSMVPERHWFRGMVHGGMGWTVRYKGGVAARHAPQMGARW